MTLNDAQARIAAEQAVQVPVTIDPSPPTRWGTWLGFAQAADGLVVPDQPPVFVNTETGTVLTDRLPPGFTYDPKRPVWDRLTAPRGLTAATWQDAPPAAPPGAGPDDEATEPAGDEDEEDEPTATILALIVDDDDPSVDIGDVDPEHHCTLLFLGDNLDASTVSGIKDAVDAFMSATPPSEFEAGVDGVATLGDDMARVWMLTAGSDAETIRTALLALDPVKAAHDAADQFPTFTPHVTIGYPEPDSTDGFLPPDVEEEAAAVDSIAFDTLALWVAGDHSQEWELVDTDADTSTGDGTDSSGQDGTPSDGASPSADQATAAVAPVTGPEAGDIPADGEPWYGILCPEGVVSGDGRRFADGSISWRDLPLPLMYQDATALGHDGAVRVARIDGIERDDTTYDHPMIRGWGVWDTSAIAAEARRQVDQQMLRGVSVDADDYVADLVDENGDPVAMEDLFFADPSDLGQIIEEATEARICGATLVSIPAFHQAYVANGQRDPSAPEPGQHEDAPVEGIEAEFVSEKPWGNFSQSDYTPEQWKRATLIHLDPAEGQDPLTMSLHKLPVYEPGGALNRAAAHSAASVLAGGRGGVDAPADKKEAAATTLIGLYNNQLDETPPDSLYRAAGKEPPSSSLRLAVYASGAPLPRRAFFERHPACNGGPVALTLDGRRIYGHLAAWGVCHIGIAGTCVTAPPSNTGYGYFATGLVETDKGPVSVGQVTMGTGHADRNLPWRPAAAHYDNTGSVVADIAIGEDTTGIWYSGLLRPGVTAEQRAALLASGALSGDWRDTGGPDLELVAALVVNVGGFPVPRLSVAASGGRQSALVASGIVMPAPRVRLEPGVPLTYEVVSQMIVASRKRAARVAALRRRIGREPAQRVAAARERIGR